MTQQVEVRLTNGETETFSADGWHSNEKDGTLDVLSSGEAVASFALGQWSFVSKVVIEDQVDSDAERLSLGHLTVNINPDDTGLRKWAEDFVASRRSPSDDRR